MSIDLNALPGGTYKAGRVTMYLYTLHALMLRDMRTRFAGSYWGWCVQILWPVAHMFLIGSVMAFRHMPCPFGDSILIFVASGAVPALAFQYVSREIMKGFAMNKPLTYYPQVKILDVIGARIIVEVIDSFAGLVVIFAVLLAVGLDPLPVNIMMALCGYLTAMFLGIGMGTVHIALVSFFPGWFIGAMLFNVIIYMSSGVVFMGVYLPEALYKILKYNPVFQVIEWVRLGYDPSLPITIDYMYVLSFGGCMLLFGLLFERLVVRHKH